MEKKADSFPAMIMAAGLGKRMRGYSNDIPKPLVEVAGEPLISYSLALLKRAGIKRMLYNTHYLPEQIEHYMAARKDVKSLPSREAERLETGGGIMKVMPRLAESFWVLNSDVICRDSNPPVIHRMQQCWDADRMDGLLLLVPVERAHGYEGGGDFSLNEEGMLTLPQRGQPAYVFTGVQHLHKRFFDHAPAGAFSLSLLYRQALATHSGRLYGIIHQGEWYHVGDPKARREAEVQLQGRTLCA